MTTHIRRGAALMAAGALTLGLAGIAGAATSEVSQSIDAGSLSASIDNLGLGAVNYSHADQVSPGTMTLTADDSTGTGDGWNVTVQASDFTYAGDNDGTAIPAENFALTAAATPSVNAGQAIDATGGPMVPTTSPVGTLDLARKVLQANADFGQGNYAQVLDVALTVPGQSRVGSYTGTLTTTITAGP